MVSLLFGLALVAAAVFLLRAAKPRPNGTPASFLSRDSVATLYALLITACVGLGIALAASGLYALSTSTG